MSSFAISCSPLRKGQKRARLSDVIESIWAQLDDLGHDLTDALIVGPKGATCRQVLIALRKIREEAV